MPCRHLAHRATGLLSHNQLSLGLRGAGPALYLSFSACPRSFHSCASVWLFSVLPHGNVSAPADSVDSVRSLSCHCIIQTLSQHLFTTYCVPVQGTGETITTKANNLPMSWSLCQNLMPCSPQIPPPHPLTWSLQGQFLALRDSSLFPQASPTSLPPFLLSDIGWDWSLPPTRRFSHPKDVGANPVPRSTRNHVGLDQREARGLPHRTCSTIT